jgi:hypothetical protein
MRWVLLALLPMAAHAQTPQQYFQHPAPSSLNGTEQFLVHQNGADKTVPLSMLPGYIAPALQGTFVSPSALNWDGQTLTYAVPNGPRVCVVVSPACPNLLPNAAAVVPSNVVTASGAQVFDPITGLYLTAN